jgi:hypothetical protein
VSTLFATLRALFAHPASHRAIDETEADWQHEQAAARTLRARAGVTMTTCGAVARLLVLSVPRETLLLLSSGRLLWRTVGFLIPFVVFIQVRPVIRYLGTFDWPLNASALPWLVPQAVPVVLPIALFYAVASPTLRRTPVLVVSVAVATFVFVIAGWIVPATNSRFRRVMFDALVAQQGGAAQTLEPERTLSTAVALNDARAWDMVVSTLSLSFCAAAMIPLATGVAALRQRVRVMAWCLFPAGLVASGFVGDYFGAVALQFIEPGAPSAIRLAVMFATVVVTQITIAIWLRRQPTGAAPNLTS